MDSRLLVQLSVAIDLGSLNRAAQRLNLTQPTLSRNIKIIEDRVGAPVLRRDSSGVVATDIGERLAESGRKILAETVQADDALRQWHDGLNAEIKLGIGPLLAATLMPRFLLGAFSGTWPYVVKVSTASAAPLIESLNAGELDIVLAPSQLNLHQERLHQRVVFPDRLVIIAGAQSPLVKLGRKVGKDDLANAKWIVAGAKAGIHGTETEIFHHLGLEAPSTRLSVTGDLMIPFELLKISDALVVLPERLFNLLGEKNGACILDADIPLVRRDISIWMRKSDQFRPEFLHFEKVFSRYLEQEEFLV